MRLVAENMPFSASAMRDIGFGDSASGIYMRSL